MRNYIEEAKLKSIVNSGVVTDEHIADYLQGLEYAKWCDGKDLEETIVTDEDGNETTVSTLVNVYEPIDVSLQVTQWKIDNNLEKQYGIDYDGYKIPFKNEDAMAMLQVKAAFEMGLTNTNIEFSNGTIMPMVNTEFATFALWFVEKRNGYFV